MKRSGPIQRRTPLASGGFQRKKGTLQRRTQLPPRRKKARRNGASHGISWQDVRAIIFVRAGGRCEVCGKSLNIHNMEGHHRRSRRYGPDCPGNAIALCSDCHHGPQVHGSPAAARPLGYIVSSSNTAPCGERVWLPVHGGWVILGCDGMLERSPDE